MEKVLFLALMLFFSALMAFMETEGTIFPRVLQSLALQLEDKMILFYYRIMNMGKVA
jgi:hypothetical protein